jgi:hypothetical protein
LNATDLRTCRPGQLIPLVHFYMGRIRLWTSLWCIQLNDPVVFAFHEECGNLAGESDLRCMDTSQLRQMIARFLYLVDDGLVAINHRVCLLGLPRPGVIAYAWCATARSCGFGGLKIATEVGRLSQAQDMLVRQHYTLPTDSSNA